MDVTVIRRTEQGVAEIRYDDGFSAVMPLDAYDALEGLPPSELRTRVEQWLIEHRADPTGGRSERDEQAMDTARDAASGEAHQEGDRC